LPPWDHASLAAAFYVVVNTAQEVGQQAGSSFGTTLALRKSVKASRQRWRSEAGRQIQFGFHCEEPVKEDVMKRNLIGILSLVVMSLLLNPTAVYAQSYAKANVPFDFKVGSAQLPSGTYDVREMGNANSVMVQNHETSSSAMAIARHENPRDTDAKLVFHKVGGQYFLAEIWRGPGTDGLIVPTSKQEKELQKELQLAGNRAGGYEEVVVALN
jgi:hypothetical protein